MKITVREAAQKLALSEEEVIVLCEEDRLFAIQQQGEWVLDDDYLQRTFPAEVWVFPDAALGLVPIFIVSDDIRLFYKMMKTRESYFEEHYEALAQKYGTDDAPLKLEDVHWPDIEKYPDMVDVAFYSDAFCEDQQLEFVEVYPKMYRGYAIEAPDFVDLFLEEEMQVTETFVLSENFIVFEKGFRLYRVLKYGETLFPGIFIEVSFEEKGFHEATLLGTRQQMIDKYSLTPEQAREFDDL